MTLLESESIHNNPLLRDDCLPEYNGIPHWKNKSLEDIPGEIWIPVLGREGRYAVSVFGRFKSFANGDRKEKIMSQTPTDERGYLRITMTENCETENEYIQILVANAFLPNPENKRTVNHKWGNVKDNRATQIEWHTHSEQHLHAYRVLGRKHALKGKTGYLSKSSKEVMCVTTGVKYGSVSEAGRLLKIPFQNISKVCKGKRPNARGLVFKFANE